MMNQEHRLISNDAGIMVMAEEITQTTIDQLIQKYNMQGGHQSPDVPSNE